MLPYAARTIAARRLPAPLPLFPVRPAVLRPPLAA